jgi:hypothetical protein
MTPDELPNLRTAARIAASIAQLCYIKGVERARDNLRATLCGDLNNGHLLSAT